MELKSQNEFVPSLDPIAANSNAKVSRSELKAMEWAKIRRLTITIHELAYLVPEDSVSRQAVHAGMTGWPEVLSIVNAEILHEEELGDFDSLYWSRLVEMRGQIQSLTEVLNVPGLPMLNAGSSEGHSMQKRVLV